LESDGPVKYSGKIGVPAMVENVLKSISTLKEINSDELEKQIEENTRKIFPRIF
jgi:Tat protein secretion system quality control protein TatD with DNase activity